ncbi:probable aspartic proteinase GIP2 [Vigna umbellata]|uniref:probable aspartic proteinase GIP2 n=1 Tax=Vigna umbellata TaxID=87088 RepID=UPI001F5E9108|nr:probable aspartic proteinase GIP2 [Vigna umbellata]
MSNPLGQFRTSNSMVEDVISLPPTYVPGFLAGCVDLDVDISDRALQGLPKRTIGIVGFSRSKLSFPSQLVLANKLPPIFFLCFPSNNLKGFGKIFIGAAAGGHSQLESKFLQNIALVVNPVATTAVSIEIDGHVVNLNPSLLSIDKNGNGGTKISTVTPWTELHSFLYKPFVQDFVKKAAGRRMKRVASEAPFDACFDSSTIENSVTGLVVPVIDLVLAGGVEWSIHGANSMVMAGKNVACLAFVNGGMKAKLSSVETSIIEGHQLEDNLLVIDEASSRLSFSSSLLLRNVTCSHV